jgi:hypothetical protein
MAFSGSFVCSSFKVDLLCARHNFLLTGGHSFRAALYTNSATPMDATRTAYSTSNEIVGTGYVAGGNVLTRIDPAAAVSPITTAITSFANTTWSSSTITNARGALIYNDTAAGKNSCLVLDFLADKSSSAGDFTIQFPPNDGTNAIIRIA